MLSDQTTEPGARTASENRFKSLMRWPVRLIREARKADAGAAMVAQQTVSGWAGLQGRLAPAGGAPPEMAVSSLMEAGRPGVPEGGPIRRVNGANQSESEPETDDFAQPSDGDGVPEDMAT